MSSKTREALEEIRSCADYIYSYPNNIGGVQQCARDIMETIDKIVSEPLRNCDVGSVEEQYVRFKKWCEGEFYKRPMNPLTGEPCKSCPCYSVSANGVDGCNYLRWAQLPYEEVK